MARTLLTMALAGRATPDPTARRWKLVRARRDAVPASMRRRFFRRGPRRRGPLVLGVLATVAAVALGWVLYGTSVLGVREIAVTGAPIAGADQVRAAAAVPIGTPLARLDTAAVEARIRTIVSVADVEVSRSWPRTLTIEVTERTAVAVVAAPAGGFLLVDQVGVVYHTVAQRPDGTALLRVAAPGPDDPSTRSALRVLAALTPPLRERLATLVAESPTRVRLELTGGVVVVWGDAEASNQKAAVATALLTRKATRIDVSSPDAATTS